MKQTNVCFVLAVGLAFAMASGAYGSSLYGVSSGTPGWLYTIDPSDPAKGAATAIAPVGYAMAASDIDFFNGKLYATNVSFGGNWTMGWIDVTTGAFTKVVGQGGSGGWTGMAANQASNVMYVFDSGIQKILTLTPNGASMDIAYADNHVFYSNLALSDMAYSPVSGLLYAVDSSKLYTIDPATGAVTNYFAITAAAVGTSNLGLAYDAASGKLFLNNGSTHKLYSLDTAGNATLIGPNGLTVNIDGLAAGQVSSDQSGSQAPEPATWMLSAGVIALVLGRARATSQKR